MKQNIFWQYGWEQHSFLRSKIKHKKAKNVSVHTTKDQNYERKKRKLQGVELQKEINLEKAEQNI